MNVFSSPAAGVVANSLLSTTASEDAIRAGRIHLAAGQLLPFLERGQIVDADDLRAIMTHAFDNYEVCEAAQGSAIQSRTGSPSSRW
ncbi:hypothetical protein [Pararhizobium sp. PWRC1-1]|uniref:hypothetical protein n=1 Tax=Pararhizobium sp. PWRC1-1 TaxID=2804566 RepID=UPI003CEECF17